MVLPHELFAFLYSYYPRNFATRFLGGGTASIANAATHLRSVFNGPLYAIVCVNDLDTPKSFWSAIPDTDPRKRQIAEIYVERADIANVDEIWGRAVPIDIHGNARRN